VTSASPVQLESIRQAQRRLQGRLSPTPLLPAQALSRKLRRRVLYKAESLQPTGSFKVRPAYNAIAAHLTEARALGVVTSSSGNFAQAAAWAARELEVDATVVMMESASEYKRERTKAMGARVELCANTFAARWETTFRIQKEERRLLLHPYDALETISGDGVIGLELLEQTDEPFCVLVPISGGGLISGIATAVKTLRPDCVVVGVQPAANPSMERSLAAGERIEVEPQRSIADALVVAKPGELTYEIASRLVNEVVLVSEDELAAAVGFLAREEKLVVEAGGAAGVAALLAGKVRYPGLTPIAVLSGGNILPSKLAQIVSAE
jgi:threonine dehydratase